MQTFNQIADSLTIVVIVVGLGYGAYYVVETLAGLALQ